MELDKRMEGMVPSMPSCPEDLCRRVMAEKFAKVEAKLFLDTHPCDREALAFYRQTCENLETLERQWERCMNPEDGRWSYVDLPWPWQKGE